MNRRIAFLHYEYPGGGAEKVTLEISRWMHGRGYGCFIFTKKLNREKLTDSDRNIFTFIEVDAPYFYEAELAGWMAGKVKEYSIDVLLAPDAFFRWMPEFRKLSDCAVISTLHSQPMFMAKFTLEEHRAELRSRGSFFKYFEWYVMRLPKYRLTRRFEKTAQARHRMAYDNSDILVTLCRSYKEELIDILKLDPVNNHVEFAYNFIPPKTYPDHRKKNQILYVGRLSHADKRPDRVIKIWSMIHNKFPDWTLLIVGDGEEKQSLEDIVKRERLPRVEFCGYRTDTEHFYRDSAILCLTSNVEGWPMVVVEAQQAGTVCASYDCSAGVREQLLPDGENGILVKPYSIRSYARKISRVMGDPAALKRMSGNSIRRFGNYISAEETCLEWEDRFERAIRISRQRKVRGEG